MSRRPIRRCTRCTRDRPHRALGLCDSCYTRRPGARRYDAPIGAAPGAPGVLRSAEVIAGRVEDYRELTREMRLSKKAAAARLGISYKTALRYEQRLRAEAAA
ncbi:hypothetical protein [Actinomadura hibisca]|uniref:hypothetical protein n=1 Tax=Actinomadura hibisca TaxID=68565 RepID=UPI000832E52B|nr:hypothetical protein [Actinomadura hibisca]